MALHVPGLFTMTIPAIVRPRNASSETMRAGAASAAGARRSIAAGAASSIDGL